jgi:hypothetical protein
VEVLVTKLNGLKSAIILCVLIATAIASPSQVAPSKASPRSASAPRLGVLYSFANGNDGSLPDASLVADQEGNLYGTTSLGGGASTSCFLGSVPDGCGTVFKLTVPSSRMGKWTQETLYSFTGGSDGSEPFSTLVMDSKGNLYGTTSEGGDLNNTSCSHAGKNVGCGVVFELSPSVPGGPWVENVIYTF